jgi:hypothetical protein
MVVLWSLPERKGVLQARPTDAGDVCAASSVSRFTWDKGRSVRRVLTHGKRTRAGNVPLNAAPK